MFEAKVYKVMVGCPGDSMEELLVAKKVIAQWNEQNAEREVNDHFSVRSFKI